MLVVVSCSSVVGCVCVNGCCVGVVLFLFSLPLVVVVCACIVVWGFVFWCLVCIMCCVLFGDWSLVFVLFVACGLLVLCVV